jgi:hypothetical protein
MYNIFLDYNISVSRIKFKKFNKIVQNIIIIIIIIIIIWYNSILDVVSLARSSGELQNQDRLGLVLAREPTRAESYRARAKFPPLRTSVQRVNLK